MEATLQKSKVKKHKLKPKSSLKVPSAPVESDKKSKETKPLILDENEQTVRDIDEKNVTNVKNDIETKVLPISEFSSDQNTCKLLGNEVTPCTIAEVSTNHIKSFDQSIVKYPDVKLLSVDPVEIKIVSPNQHVINTKVHIQQMYPDLKSIQYCEQMHNIVCSQTLIKTYTEEYQIKAVNEANKAFDEFALVTHELNKHPFWEMVNQYHNSRKSCIRLRSRIKYLRSNLKRKKDSLWKPVKKEVFGKGKCEDGYSVQVSHSFIIKELDQDIFNEVMSTLKEIEESMSLDAFNSYLEKLMKLRIEHYLSGLVVQEQPDECPANADILSNKEFVSLKKCISILFDCQRQNVQDKTYVGTSKQWLKMLVSKLIQNENFRDNLFLINHVMRCPSGIEKWASQFIQVPFDVCASDQSKTFDCICLQRLLLVLFLIFNPVPHKDFFLKNIKESVLTDCIDGNFTVLDSEGEEEEIDEVSKNWSDADILSLLNRIPVRKLYQHLLLETIDSSDGTVKVHSEEKLLKLFAYSTAVIDVLFTGMETHGSENLPEFFESISNLIKHILCYISEFWIFHAKLNSNVDSPIQAVYDQLFFHIIYKICVFEKLNIFKVLSALPYQYTSRKMFWNIMWIFFCPGRSEEDLYTEKDVESKIQDESLQLSFINQIKSFSKKNTLNLLHAFEKIALTCNGEEDFIKFLIFQIFKITFIETALRDDLSNEGSVILSSILQLYPHLVSVLLKTIDENNDTASCSINLFKKINFMNWIPGESDISIISSWLLSNPLADPKNHLARLILKNMNWDFNKEGSLFLPKQLHQRIAMLVTQAYLKFDSNGNEWLVSRGVKQMLQFASIGYYREDEGFIHWAWYILFSLKLHPLDRKCPPWILIYDGNIDDCDKPDIEVDVFFEPLLTAFKQRHPSGCYLMIVMTNVGLSKDDLLEIGLSCLTSLVENEQYMAAIKSLYYLLPFFVKNSEQLLDRAQFVKVMNDLITADMSVMSNITGEAVIGAVLHKIAAMIKHQIYQAWESTVECTIPLLKLWIRILMTVSRQDKGIANNLKYPTKQIYFLLDVLVKISYLDYYIRDCTLDLFSSFRNPLLSPTTNQPFWKRMFSSNHTTYTILNRCTVPEYPWLAWYVLSSEMKHKQIQDLWLKIQLEMVKINNNFSPPLCLKKVSDFIKMDQPPMESLPIYRWALQAIETPVSHPVSPLLWQQFFIYFFHKVSLPNTQIYISIGMKYFKQGSFVALMNRIKKHLSEAEKYYRNYLNVPDFQSTPSVANIESDKGGTNSFFYVKVLKLFHAFQLWVNDESLHDSKLCLTALEPKYYPARLERILNGDQNVWYDMILNDNLKEELDQKVHSWHIKKNLENTSENSDSINKEPLPKQILRHIESYEKPKSNLCDVPANVVLHEMSNTAFTSWDALVHVINLNQSIIFSKAKYFSEQMKKMKQLNFNFINWVPQEYINEDSEIILEKLCHKGVGSNGCSGSAQFKLKIQKCVKNERISERIYNNRGDYIILQDTLSKLPVDDLCLASLHVENFIKSLSSRMKTGESKETAHLKEMGVALFYQQIDVIEKIISSVAEYSPSRQFFSSIIESLGREFIDGDDSELIHLMNSVLNHPEAGSLALPLFNPNKSSLSNFQRVYKNLSSVLGKHSSSVLLALFSKIDLSLWLKENAPNFDCRKEIFKVICNALVSCGTNPSLDILPVFEILKKHFRIILSYMFPELFPETVVFLLNGIENKNLCVDVYYDAFYCFGCPVFNAKTTVADIESALRKFVQNQQLPANQKIFISVAQLNLNQIRHASKFFYHHFMKKQSSDLYKNHSDYVKPLGIFLAIISHTLIALHLDEHLTYNQILSVSELFEDFHLPFWPWLHPFEEKSSLIFPWSDQEISIAQYMVEIFSMCVKYFHEQLLSHNTDESVLSNVWNIYIKLYVMPGYRHYSVSLCHSAFLQLPWHQFHPSACDIEGMCKVLQSDLHESKEFLSMISLKIPWCDVMRDISQTKSPDYVGKVLATLGKLLIISQLNCVEIENNLCPSKFKELEFLSWNFLSLEDTESLLNLYYSNCDPLFLLNNSESNPDIHIFQFFKVVCCMVSNANDNEYSNSKRILFLKKYTSALSSSIVSKEAQILKSINKFKAVFSALLDEINDVISNGVSLDKQMSYALPLVKEIVLLLNVLPEGELDTAVLNSIISWLNMNTQSPLLMPFLKASSCHLSSISHMVSFCECCISARFTSEVLDPGNTGSMWLFISSLFRVPSSISDEFVQKCVEENCYLSLYCYVLHTIPQSVSIEQKQTLLKRLVQWVRGSELKPEAESKILLLWDKVLELSTILVLQDECQVVKEELISFCFELGNLAEDKSSSGFFAAIGFGQASSLSVNFRFLCRVMSAFLLYQIPTNSSIRIEPTCQSSFPDSSNETSKASKSNHELSHSTSAVKALENLKASILKKPYAALQSQIEYAVKCILDPTYNLLESRKLLKYFAVALYPKESYLSTLDN